MVRLRDPGEKASRETHRSQPADEWALGLLQHGAEWFDECEDVPQANDGVDSLLDELARRPLAVLSGPSRHDDALFDGPFYVQEAR